MSTTNEAVKLASVPIVDRGIGWQADATATLKAQAAQIAMLLADVEMLRKRHEEAAALADSEGTRAVAYLRRARRSEDLLSRFEPLHARGVVDADDNLDCWDTEPYEMAERQVQALNEKDSAARWRVVELWARDMTTKPRCMRPMSDGSFCGLVPPCPDCGRACHDVPEGA